MHQLYLKYTLYASMSIYLWEVECAGPKGKFTSSYSSIVLKFYTLNVYVFAIKG